MTQEKLEELYNNVMENRGRDDSLKTLKQAAANGDTEALQTIERIVDASIEKAEAEDSVNACVILQRCRGVDAVRQTIRDYFTKFITQKTAAGDVDTTTFGIASWTMFDLTNEEKHFLDYVKAAVKAGVWSNENTHMEERISDFIKEEKHTILNALPAIFAAGLNGMQSSNCIRWLSYLADNYAPLKDVVFNVFKDSYDTTGNCGLLWELYNRTTDPCLKWGYFVSYYERYQAHTEIVDAHFPEINTYYSGDLTNFIARYLGISGLRQRFTYDVQLLNGIRRATASDAANAVDYLQHNPCVDSDLNYLRFLYSVTQYDGSKPQDYLDKLYQDYHNLFDDELLCAKLRHMKNPVIDAVMNQYAPIQSACAVLDETQLPGLTHALHQNVNFIAQTIADATLYSPAADVVSKWQNVRLAYSFVPKKIHHEGTDYPTILRQARKVYAMMRDCCTDCTHRDNCPLCRALPLLARLTEEENTELLQEILRILRGNNEVPILCVNKPLWKEIIILKNMILDQTFDYRILGEYYDAEQKVVLYLANIRECKADIVQTYAHELFHAYHAACVKEAGKAWSYHTDAEKIVAESLASYFENIFSNDGREWGPLPESWDSHTIYAWPYAGAKHLMPYGGGYRGAKYPTNVLFRYVFQESVRSIAKAFKPIEFGEKMATDDF